jgi:hypothetical protein
MVRYLPFDKHLTTGSLMRFTVTEHSAPFFPCG